MVPTGTIKGHNAGAMRVYFWKGGCFWSIVLSIALTLVLNLALRAC